MNYKHWLQHWFVGSALFVLSAFLIVILVSESTAVPLRFTKSISYDIKIKFIRDKIATNNYDMYIVGSSMALNNIDSAILESSNVAEQVLNLSSWGMGASECLQLLKLMDLSSVKRVVYASQFFDYVGDLDKVLDPDGLKKFLNGAKPYKSYFRNIASLPSSIWSTLDLRNQYHRKDAPNLVFDENGDVNYDGRYFLRDKARWAVVPEVPETPLGDVFFKHLIALQAYLAERDIQLTVTTNPYRKNILSKNKALENFFYEHTDYLAKLAGREGFIYVNAHRELKLNDDLFVDPSHLNSQGAEKITRLVVDKIRESDSFRTATKDTQ